MTRLVVLANSVCPKVLGPRLQGPPGRPAAEEKGQTARRDRRLAFDAYVLRGANVVPQALRGWCRGLLGRKANTSWRGCHCLLERGKCTIERIATPLREEVYTSLRGGQHLFERRSTHLREVVGTSLRGGQQFLERRPTPLREEANTSSAPPGEEVNSFLERLCGPLREEVNSS